MTIVDNPRILIAEDVESNYLYLSAVLSKIKAKIYWAKNGKEAVDALINNEVDLVLMDMKMPDMNGFDATKKIKEENKDLPIIAQTAYAMSTDEESCLNAGCDDYISKPIRIDDLLKKIELYLKPRLSDKEILKEKISSW